MALTARWMLVQAVGYVLLGGALVYGLALSPPWGWLVASYYGANAGYIIAQWACETRPRTNVLPFPQRDRRTHGEE